MRKFWLFYLLVSFHFCIQAQEITDSLEFDEEELLVSSEEGWDKSNGFEFNGVLNKHLDRLISESEDLNLIQKWDNNMCYTARKENDLLKLKDTIWICLTDDEHEEFRLPFNGVVTSRYGYRKGRYHNGIDIDLVTGDTVKASWNGVVRYAKYNRGGFGNLVIIRHHNGLETFYAHLSDHMVVPNQEIKAGDPIGLGGNTGNSRGSHLHFEVRFFDAPINPEEVIDFDKKECKGPNLFIHRDLFIPGAKPSDKGGAIYASAYNHRAATIAKRKYYTVRSGDTLSEIASRNNTRTSVLCKLNGIRSTTTLRVGRRLRIK
jgi:hypothetical protein